MPKLTLHVSDQLVATAKREAAARRVSVSKLVSDFFAALDVEKSDRASADHRLAPATGRLARFIPDADLESRMGHLEQKHS